MRLLLNIICVITVISVLSGCSKKDAPVDPVNEPADAKEAAEQPKTVPAAVIKPHENTKAIDDIASQAAKVVFAESGIGMKAAALEGMTWIKGDTVTFKDDQVYVVEFWATWCPPCRASIPHLTEIQKQYKDKLTIIGVSSEAPSVIRPFVDDMGDKMAYTVAADSQGNAQKNYSQAFGQGGIPHAFVIDQKGRIAWVGHPMDGMDQIIKLVMDGDYDPVAAAKEKAEQEALDKQLMEWYAKYFSTITTLGISEENTKIANLFIEKAHPEALNAMAWNILTLAEKDKRQLDIALKAAEKANQLTNSSSPAVLDTYALALFENGKTVEAIATQQKAVELAGENKLMQAEMTKALEKYKAALAESESASTVKQ